jgi:hypothetical protein
MHTWAFHTATFRERLGIGGGDTSHDDQLVRRVFERAGAHVMGRRMFDEGEVGWPEEAPFRSPVFVLTHHAREPWKRKGGTTFYFVIDGSDEQVRADGVEQLAARDACRLSRSALMAKSNRCKKAARPIQVTPLFSHLDLSNQISRFRTNFAFFSMKSRRGSTSSPMSIWKIRSASTASSTSTLSSVRTSGSIVVFQS